MLISKSGLILVLVACIACAGPRIRIESNAPTIQEQCGVTRDAPVSLDQANCIAVRIGLERGVTPWTIKEDVDSTENLQCWVVSNTTDRGIGDRGCGARGRSAFIAKSDGMVVNLVPWTKVCT